MRSDEIEAFSEFEEDTLPGREPDVGARVLVVDDDPRMRELVEEWLCQEGYDVCEAISGYDLIDRLETMERNAWPFAGVDLMLVDHRMPGMTGLDALARLRGERWETRAVLMTAFPSHEIRRRARELGVAVLAKPFSCEDLCHTVLDAFVETSAVRELG
jgi:two-component system response regulator (stage 0 sporulation protein F)